jgi:hypothetical protein
MDAGVTASNLTIGICLGEDLDVEKISSDDIG